MLLYEPEKFLIVLLYLHVTFSILNPSDLFSTVSCYKCFGHWFIALSTCVEPWFVEECRFPSNIQFVILLSYIWFLSCVVTQRRGRFFLSKSVLYFYWALECTLIYAVLIFGMKFYCNQGIWVFFIKNLCQLQLFVWARPEDHQLQNLQQI